MSLAVKYRLSTKDLTTIALLSALGGVLSTYVGYLGNLVNHIVGVPFGAGQFMAGLHVLWILLAVGITRKKGVGTATGTLKGVVEFFLGSTHGVVIIVVSMVQGLLVDLLLLSDGSKRNRNLATYSVAGAIASASNVIVFQAFFFSGVPLVLIAMLCMLAAASGMIFGGWLSLELLSTLEYAGLVEGNQKVTVDVVETDPIPGRDHRRRRAPLLPIVVVSVFLAAFTIGAVYYYAEVYSFGNSNSVSVGGHVAKPYDFFYDDYKDKEVTVNAELNGDVTHEPARNYTGIPLHFLLTAADPSANASEVVVRASDGYSANFPFSQVMSDGELIIVQENGAYRIVAANFEGAYWVDGVISIEVR
jgi:ABC-type thiamin/hydroxymethylpyrimidine transport system permease subunit